MFQYTKKELGPYHFTWNQIGDIKTGRRNLGEQMPVAVYRLFEYCMRDTLEQELGKEKMIELFHKTGFTAGRELALNLLDLTQDINTVFAQLQETFKTMEIGILRVEKIIEETGSIFLTVGEDLDCSGLPVTGETVCYYDEGLIEGILTTYTHSEYSVKEIDCWSTGARVCRFHAQPAK
ncbi:MAG: 4-vinyl reductase [Hespellia sp.]|nr:4-vinyl reductase [Hespellia sp.]